MTSRVDPLLQSRQELLSAQSAMESMRSSPTLQHADLYWRNFLGHLEKVWFKTAATCKSQRTWHSFNSRYHHERDNDPLLDYLSGARDAETHTIQDVSDPIMGMLSGAFEERLQIRFSGPEIVVVPVISRNKQYSVPATHLGQDLPSRSALALGALGLAYYNRYVEAAHATFFAGTVR
jgi:hypothetical protein